MITAFGAAGSLSRYGMGHAARNIFGKSFPYDTLIVNVIGCFLIGFIAYSSFAESMDPQMKTALFVGFLGAFTTFSAFGYATFEFIRMGSWMQALLNASLNLLIGILAVWVGMYLSRVLL